MTRTTTAKCTNCDTPMTVKVGLKSTARTVRCEACGAGYDYSCWSTRRTNTLEIFKVELFPMDTLEEDEEDEHDAA